MSETKGRPVNPESLLRRAGFKLEEVSGPVFQLARKLRENGDVTPDLAARMLRAFAAAGLRLVPELANWAVIGIDIGSGSIRVGAVGPFGELLYATRLPFSTCPPDSIPEVQRLLEAGIRITVRECNRQGAVILGIAVATTISNVVPLDCNLEPLGPMIVWTDTDCIEEAAEVAEHNRLLGEPLSSVTEESVLPRLLREFRRDTKTARETEFIVEMCEYVAFWLTGKLRANLPVRLRKWRFRDPPMCLLESIGLASHARKLALPGVSLSDDVGSLRPELAAQWGFAEPVSVFLSGWDTLAAAFALRSFEKGTVVISLGRSWNVTLAVPDGMSEPPAPLELFDIPGCQTRLAGAGLRNAGLIHDACLQEFCQKEIQAARRDGVSVYEVIDRRTCRLSCVCSCAPSDERWHRRSPEDYFTLRLELPAHEPLTPLHVYKGVRAGLVHQLADLIHEVDRQMPGTVSVVRASGGFSESDSLMQEIADCTRKLVERGPGHEVVLGAALLSYTHLGFYATCTEAMCTGVRMRRAFVPGPQEWKSPVVRREPAMTAR